MENRIAVGVVLALCAACGGDVEVSSVPCEEFSAAAGGGSQGSSGTRLRRIMRTGSDGSREFAAWYDSERDEDCEFQVLGTAEKPIRGCFPLVDVAAPAMFADSSCLRAIAPKPEGARAGRDGAPLKEYVLHPWGQTKNDVARMYTVSDRVYVDASDSQPVTVKRYVIEEPGVCEFDGVEIRRPLVFLDEIGVDDFVAWTDVVE